jgi:hypothetical protein
VRPAARQGGAGGAGGGKTMTRAAFDAATPAAKAEFAKKRRHRHRLIDRVYFRPANVLVFSFLHFRNT